MVNLLPGHCNGAATGSGFRNIFGVLKFPNVLFPTIPNSCGIVDAWYLWYVSLSFLLLLDEAHGEKDYSVEVKLVKPPQKVKFRAILLQRFQPWTKYSMKQQSWWNLYIVKTCKDWFMESTCIIAYKCLVILIGICGYFIKNNTININITVYQRAMRGCTRTHPWNMLTSVSSAKTMNWQVFSWKKLDQKVGIQY